MRNQSLAIMAKSSITSLIVAASLLAGMSATASDPVYKWKDANGQSHYSQQPPQGIKYETMTPAGTAATAPVAAANAADTAKAPAASGQTPAQIERQKYCDTARKSVDVLTTHPLVDMDINGDGKPVRLTPEQQTAQLEKAKQQVAALCPK